MSNVTQVVAKHYNELKEKGIEARKESRIYFMRSFNNWIKSMLITDVVKRLNRRELVVLDMCCGKGGDIQKWVKSNSVGHVVFVDIAETSVEQCRDRYNNLNRKPFSAEFIVADCTKETLSQKYSYDVQFDLVSVQFSFHYSFESYSQASKMVENISENLRPGGYFIGTTPNANRIVKLLRETGASEFGNDVFNIKFETKEPLPVFGAKYYFQLDEVVNCPEFLVNFPTFEALCQKCGLKLVYKSPFDEFFNRMLRDGHFLLERMQALQTYPDPEGRTAGIVNQFLHAENFLQSNQAVKYVGTLSQSEWQTVALYIVFVFQKL